MIHHDTYPEINPLTSSDCSGKAVLITGASKGLGRAIAIGYAEAGASHIAVAARSDVSSTVTAVREAAKNAGRDEPTVFALEMDVSDMASVRAAAERLTTEWRRLDILVNNAGYMAPFNLLLDTDDDEYMKAWDVNYWGTYRVTKAFLPLMLKGGDKTIVNMSSVAAHFMGAGGGAYHVSKFALIRFTEFVQDEYGDQVRLMQPESASYLTDETDGATGRGFSHSPSTLVVFRLIYRQTYPKNYSVKSSILYS